MPDIASIAATIERQLAGNGIPEGRRDPYRTTARGMFAHLAAHALAGPADARQLHELVGNARNFVARFWQEQSRQDRHYSSGGLAIVGAHKAVFWIRGIASLQNGGMIVSKPKLMASIRSTAPVAEGRSPTPAVTAEARARLPDLVARLQRRVAERTGDIVPLAIRTRHRWHSVMGEIDGHAEHLAGWSDQILAHRSDDDLLEEAGHIGGAIITGREELRRFVARNGGIIEKLHARTAATGLPISLHLAPAVIEDRAAPPGQERVALRIRGYGPAGQDELVHVGQIRNDILKDAPRRTLDQALAVQRRRHGLFGPAPGGAAVEWQVDRVTARRLAGRQELVERCLAEGKADGGDLKLRIDGRRILGEFKVSPTVIWRGTELRATGVAIPETIIQSVAGRDLDQVVQAAALEGGGTVVSGRADTTRKETRLRLRIRPTMVGIDTIAA